MGVKFNIGFSISPETVSAARSASGMVSKSILRIRQFQLIGLANALVGSILKTQPGDASARANQLRSCARAFNAPADANRRQALSMAADSLDAASAAFSRDASEISINEAVEKLETSFGGLVSAFQITGENNNLLTITDMPEPEDRRIERGDDNDAADPFNTPIMKRGKRRAE